MKGRWGFLYSLTSDALRVTTLLTQCQAVDPIWNETSERQKMAVSSIKQIMTQWGKWAVYAHTTRLREDLKMISQWKCIRLMSP